MFFYYISLKGKLYIRYVSLPRQYVLEEETVAVSLPYQELVYLTV